jgi:hypothetical protein
LVLAGLAVASTANGGTLLHLAQTSTTTGCMMACNSLAASCQTSCVVPGSASSGTSTSTTGNTTAGASCLSNCSSEQLACQTNCARVSPSR